MLKGSASVFLQLSQDAFQYFSVISTERYRKIFTLCKHILWSWMIMTSATIVIHNSCNSSNRNDEDEEADDSGDGDVGTWWFCLPRNAFQWSQMKPGHYLTDWCHLPASRDPRKLDTFAGAVGRMEWSNSRKGEKPARQYYTIFCIHLWSFMSIFCVKCLNGSHGCNSPIQINSVKYLVLDMHNPTKSK